MKNKGKIVLILLLASSLSSCGVFNKVFKTSSKLKESTEVEVSKVDETKIEDKSTTIIEEKSTSPVKLPAKSTEVQTPLNNLTDINNLVLLNDNLVTVRQTYDTLSKKLFTYVNLKERDVDVPIDKKTTINNNINTTNKSKQDSSFKQDIKKKETVKQKEPKNTFWYVVLCLVGLSAAYLIIKKFVFKK